MLSMWAPFEVAYPVIAISIASAVLVVEALRRGILLPVFASLSWLTFMQLPFVLQASEMSVDIAKGQAWGIAIIGFSLICGDLVGLRRAHSEDNVLVASPENHGLLLILSAIFVIFVVWLPIYHLMHVPRIPLLDAFSEGYSKQTAESRENFGKLLDIPRIYKVQFTWVATVFGPLLVVLALVLIKNRCWSLIAVGAVLAWVSCYELLSTAKQPILALVMYTGVATVGFWSGTVRRLARVFIVFGFAAFTCYCVYYSYQLVAYQNEFGSKSESYRNLIMRTQPENDIRSFSIGDVSRLIDSNKEPIWRRVPHYLVYRIFLTPVEVSNNWYAYFPKVGGEWRSLKEIAGILPPNTTHAANRVGRWAYVERFPDHYLESASAYASIDADAYSFGGLMCVVAAGVILFLLRIIASMDARTSFGRSVSRLVICQIGLLAVNASLQAIFVVHGAGILLAVLLVVLFFSRRVVAPPILPQ